MTDKLIEKMIQKPVIKEIKIGSYVRRLSESTGSVGIVTSSHYDSDKRKCYTVTFDDPNTFFMIPHQEIEEIHPKPK